jgi:iron(II)-dependent oxidoreductase
LRSSAAAGVNAPTVGNSHAPGAAGLPAGLRNVGDELLLQGRSALLLERQLAATLGEELLRRASEALQQTMAMIPEGPVILEEGSPAQAVRVERFFLDRCAVTNRLYARFVAAGGYRQESLWDIEAWPAVPAMLDRSGQPGPCYWKNGAFPPGEEDFPVVGVCWHEALAFARWAGKRLPSDAEWVKAAEGPADAGPVAAALAAAGSADAGTAAAAPAAAGRPGRFPWGEEMAANRANLWGSGPGGVVAVDDFAAGTTAGGVCQLIGNVWEWTAGGSGQKRTIRGGAFDTFYDNQAPCPLQSCEDHLARCHNIGFRCAVTAADLLINCNLSQP